MDHKDGKWAREIIALQKDDGTWGECFHTLSQPVKDKPLTTEQALRRLWILGFTIDDAPIRKAVDYMTSCLRGERKMDDKWEKTHNWELFTKLMLSSWIKIFEPDNELALHFAKRWARVIEKAFENGAYNRADYQNAYISEFDSKLNGAREIDFTSFYQMVLLQGVLSRKTEDRLLDYVLSKPDGIYYIYGKQISEPPERFDSREASCYLAALEILSGYDLASEKLAFAADWLSANRDINNEWDFGIKAGDKVYFPLSDSWRKDGDRKADCTERVNAFLSKLGAR